MAKPRKNNGIDWKALLVSIIICNLAGAIGSIFTFEAIPNWYATLTKPSFSPPNWVFGPVWTTLYLLMGISAYLIWEKSKKFNMPLKIFALQLFLNALWSFIFFGMKNPALAFLEIIALWLSVAYTIVLFYKLDKRAAYLLLPYIAWITFASVLNYFIWKLN